MDPKVTTVVLVVCGVALVVLTVYLVRMASQLIRTGAALEKLARSLDDSTLPRLDGVLDEAREQLTHVRGVAEAAQRAADGADRIVGVAGDLADRARDSVSPVFDAVHDLSGHLRQVVAVVAGVRAGLSILRKPEK